MAHACFARSHARGDAVEAACASTRWIAERRSVATTNLGAIRDGWIKEQWAEHALWPAQATPAEELRRRFRSFFRESYRESVRLAG